MKLKFTVAIPTDTKIWLRLVRTVGTNFGLDRFQDQLGPMFAVFTGFGPVFLDSENAGTSPGWDCLNLGKETGPDRTFKH